MTSDAPAAVDESPTIEPTHSARSAGNLHLPFLFSFRIVIFLLSLMKAKEENIEHYIDRHAHTP